MDEVYQWALAQETIPIYTSEYIPKVLEFYDVSMSKNKNTWKLYGMKHLKTLRFNRSKPNLVYKGSQNLMGQKTEETQSYVHLNTNNAYIELKEGPIKDESYLIDTNAQVLNYLRSDKEISFTLKGYVNLVLNYHLRKGCTLESKPKGKRKKTAGSKVELKFKTKETDVLIQCQ